MDQRWTEGDGERLEGEVSVGYVEWEEAALKDKAQFASRLHDVGLPDDEIADGMSVLGQVSSQIAEIDRQIKDLQSGTYFMLPPELLDLYTKRQSVLERLSDWFSRQTIRVDRTVHSALRVPVFVLSAPAIDGCSASFATSTQLTRNIDCRVAIFGPGMGESYLASCQAKCTFVCNAGDTKVVFIPAELTVGELSVLAKGRVISQGFHITAVQFTDPEPAVTLVPRDAYPSLGARIKTYPLTGDTTGDVSTYGYKYKQSQTAGFSLKVEAFGADIGFKVEVALEREVELTYALKGGYDYSLHYLDEGEGIAWRTLNA